MNREGTIRTVGVIKVSGHLQCVQDGQWSPDKHDNNRCHYATGQDSMLCMSCW